MIGSTMTHALPEAHRMAETFTFFWKHRLSQWHRAPFVVGGVTFQYAEQPAKPAKKAKRSRKRA